MLIRKLKFCLFPSNVIWLYHVDYTLIKTDYECKSSDQSLGEFASLEECANACKKIAGCHFFDYGKETKQGRCYWEKTSDSSCPEGWLPNQYDFYALTSMFNSSRRSYTNFLPSLHNAQKFEIISFCCYLTDTYIEEKERTCDNADIRGKKFNTLEEASNACTASPKCTAFTRNDRGEFWTCCPLVCPFIADKAFTLFRRSSKLS